MNPLPPPFDKIVAEMDKTSAIYKEAADDSSRGHLINIYRGVTFAINAVRDAIVAGVSAPVEADELTSKQIDDYLARATPCALQRRLHEAGYPWLDLLTIPGTKPQASPVSTWRSMSTPPTANDADGTNRVLFTDEMVSWLGCYERAQKATHWMPIPPLPVAPKQGTQPEPSDEEFCHQIDPDGDNETISRLCMDEGRRRERKRIVCAVRDGCSTHVASEIKRVLNGGAS